MAAKPRTRQPFWTRAEIFGASRYLKWVALAAAFLALIYLTSDSSTVPLARYVNGEPLEAPFVAPFDLEVPNISAQRLAAEAAERDAPAFFKIDLEARKRSHAALDKIVKLAQEAAQSSDSAPATTNVQTTAQKFPALAAALAETGTENVDAAVEILVQRGGASEFVTNLKESLAYLLDERGLISLALHDRLRLAHAQERMRWTEQAGAPDAAFLKGDPAESLWGFPTPAREYLLPYLREHFIGRELAPVRDILMAVAEPDVVFDADATDAERSRMIERQMADAGSILYRAGDVVVPAGVVIGPEQAAELDAFRAKQKLYRLMRVLGVAIFVAILFRLVALYERKFPGETLFSATSMAIVSLPTILAFLIWRINEALGLGPYLGGFGFPAALVGMLTVTLLGARLSWIVLTCTALLFGLAAGMNFQYVVFAMLGGFAAIAALYTTKTRRDILIAGLVVGLINALNSATMSLIDGAGESASQSLLRGGVGMANGIVCGALTLPLLWVFERAFGVVTDFRLLELTGIHHPLLQELEDKAPGSYQHTLNVTKLAESAAKAIGANYLLVRAGGYFHDIGKIVKPRYFTENQLTQEDRQLHFKLTPSMSTLIIKNHVKEGLEIARKYNLPPEVLAFIPEHQGTTLIHYFYQQALKRFQESESTTPVREEEFRYPGPKPQSIETAIVMLADSVEATATAMVTTLTTDEDELRQVVRRAIATKFNDGQFDECDLTLRELHIITETFVKTLKGRFHHRIAYPKAEGNGTQDKSAQLISTRRSS